MAAAFKCDICGDLYEGYDGLQYEGFGNYFNMIGLCSRSTSRRFDTCPDCMRAIITFLHSREHTCEVKKGED